MSFAADIAAGIAKARDVAGVTVTVSRDGDTCSPKAIPASAQWEMVDGDGIPTGTRPQDFLIATDDYAPGGTAVDPAHGDKIEMTISGSSVAFDVVDGPEGLPFRPMDPARTQLRVFTVESA